MGSLLLPTVLQHISWQIFSPAGCKLKNMWTKFTDCLSECPCIPLHISPHNLQLPLSWFPRTFPYHFFALVDVLSPFPSQDIIWNHAMQQSTEKLKCIELAGLQEGIIMVEGILDIAQHLFHLFQLLQILQMCFYLLLCFFIFPRMNRFRSRWLPEICGLTKSPYSKIALFQAEKKEAIKVIYGLENSAISTCLSLHRWSSVECILLLKLSWRYWECWLRVKEMSKPSGSAKLCATDTESTGSTGKAHYSPHGHWQISLLYFIFHYALFKWRRDVSERVFMPWPRSVQRGGISDKKS